jgi:ADP-ribose pyrophosphatase YjhB (NUDIX family)
MTKIKESAGLLIIQDNKILLCHPTSAPWKNTYSIPKGAIESGETKMDAALRETREEVGIIIDRQFIDDKEYVIEYKNKNNVLYKKVYYFILNLDDAFLPLIFPKNMLQLKEVDYAAFYNKEDAEKLIFWRFSEMLNNLK